MPIEIRELHVKVHVDQARDDSRPTRTDRREKDDALVQACVEQVLEILNRKEER